jgi:beta-glucosidase
MKSFFRILKWFLFLVFLFVIGLIASLYWNIRSIKSKAQDLMTGPAPALTIQGMTFRDLNKNGKLDPYENFQLDPETRVEDLLAQMTLEEKAAQLFQPFLFSTKIKHKGKKIAGLLNPPENYIILRGLSHLTSSLAPDDALVHIRWANQMQALAEQTRLGIPITFSSDPRHSNKKGAAEFMKSLSQWPDATGFAALRDSNLTVRFGQIAAREYRAIGLHTALHPVADLATEPRWGRIAGTFGEDAALSSKLTAAYIHGMQGDSLGPTSVSTMTKHFPGGGPQKDGWDAHFKYGKEQVYPGNNFAYHLIPFKAAIKAGTAQMMPYYGIPIGQTNEDVGFAFNKEIINDLLLDSLRYTGIVCSDWGVLRDPSNPMNRFLDPMDHGVEHLDFATQVEKALIAGIDQFGGNDNPSVIVQLVKEERISEARIERSVRKLLHQKFVLGLFDNPYVNEQTALNNIARPEDIKLGYETMIRSSVLLKNQNNILPLRGKPKVYVENLDKELAANYFELSEDPETADFALLNLPSPFEPRKGIIESLFHQGRLHYTSEEIDHYVSIMQVKPTIVLVYLERPILIPEISQHAAALIGHFSISEKAILGLVSGEGQPEGKLPFELPSSVEAVEQQLEDVPYDSKAPLYPFGFGIAEWGITQ